MMAFAKNYAVEEELGNKGLSPFVYGRDYKAKMVKPNIKPHESQFKERQTWNRTCMKEQEKFDKVKKLF
jgi:hypothetical protein